MSETLKRITVQEVRAAGAKTGFPFCRAAYVKSLAYGGCELCGLSMLAVASEKIHWLRLVELQDNDEFDALMDELCIATGVRLEYANGFAEGFDGVPEMPGSHALTRLGHADGQACAAAIFPKEPA